MYKTDFINLMRTLFKEDEGENLANAFIFEM